MLTVKKENNFAQSILEFAGSDVLSKTYVANVAHQLNRLVVLPLSKKLESDDKLSAMADSKRRLKLLETLSKRLTTGVAMDDIHHSEALLSMMQVIIECCSIYVEMYPSLPESFGFCGQDGPASVANFLIDAKKLFGLVNGNLLSTEPGIQNLVVLNPARTLIASTSTAGDVFITLRDLGVFNDDKGQFQVDSAQYLASLLCAVMVKDGHHSVKEIGELYNRLLYHETTTKEEVDYYRADHFDAFLPQAIKDAVITRYHIKNSLDLKHDLTQVVRSDDSEDPFTPHLKS